jgi:hypothetical protein
VDKKISESILKQKWPKKYYNIEDNPYKLHVLAYSREMD